MGPEIFVSLPHLAKNRIRHQIDRFFMLVSVEGALRHILNLITLQIPNLILIIQVCSFIDDEI